MTKRKTALCISISLVLAIALLFLLLNAPSFAFFRTFFDKQGSNTVMVELIFDRLDFDNPEILAKGFAEEENGVEIPWGSERNPYVISQKHHIQNLSVLQNSGFFASRVEKDANGNPILVNGKTVPLQSYFLVCNTDGTPTTVNCEGMTVDPIGSHENPFTGVISGAPLSGTTIYGGYEASLSTISNLTVKSNLDEPDIGFFGKLGYVGEYNEEDLTVTGGFAACIEDVLFADVTISSERSFLDTLAKWWNEMFSAHINHSETRQETHHVGIIAGHAEFATIRDVSVYYSDDVIAFNLVSDEDGSNTNYYSSTGLIGFLECVNPAVDDNDGTLDGSSGIRDSDLIGDGSSGGGGAESGTLTGYFLAKNLFERHENYLTAYPLDKKDKYNVMEMKDVDGSDLFKSVTMRERDTISDRTWDLRTYYYFQDTVFTFAMSMSVLEGTTVDEVDEKESDFIQKIWKLEENRPSVMATETANKLQYVPADPDATPRISYSLVSETSLTDGGYYVLAFYQKNGTEDTSDDVLFIVNINDIKSERGYVHQIPIGKFVSEGITDDELNGSIEYYSASEGAGIKSINLVGVNQEIYDYAFVYDKTNSVSIKSVNTDHKLGVMSNYVNLSYTTPTTVVDTTDVSDGLIGSDTEFYYNWNFTAHSTDKGRFSIAASYSLRKLFVTKYCWSALQFNGDAVSFNSVMESSSSNRNDKISYGDENYFYVYRVNKNTVNSAGSITSLGGKNEILTPMNILPVVKENEDGTESRDTLYEFDPSKYVLEYVGPTNETSEGRTVNGYKLAPIRSYKLNDGTGNLLTEINHIAKLYKTHNDNYQLTIGNTFLGNFVGDWLDTNTGGVLNTTIGTSNDELYSIPTGMIAFEINKASVSEPSYINIIVAVNPEQEMTGTIGVWRMNKQNWQQSFNLNNPTYSFDLPISKTAKGFSDKEYMIKITEHVAEIDEEGKKIYTTVKDENGNNETSYIYLGGQTVLVYYRFEITSPDVYLLGSQAGPLSVAYFSVSGAAGAGNDGMSGSPLGMVDFVYAYNGKIITTDKYDPDDTELFDAEDYNEYYPSYLFVSMLPEKNKIQHEVVKIKRYIKNDDLKGTKRHLSLNGQIYTRQRSVSILLQDSQDDLS